MEKIKAIRFVGSLFKIRLGRKELTIEDTKGQFLENNNNLEADLIGEFLVVISRERSLVIRVYTKKRKDTGILEKVFDASFTEDKSGFAIRTFNFTP